METPQVHPSSPRRDKLNINPSLDTTQVCASKSSPLIPNPSSPSAPEGCVGYSLFTSHSLALASPDFPLSWVLPGTGTVTLWPELFANLKGGSEEIPGLPWVCFPGAKLMSHFPCVAGKASACCVYINHNKSHSGNEPCAKRNHRQMLLQMRMLKKP